MGFLNGVKRVSSGVTACSKKLKSKTPGFLDGVARLSSRCVRAWSRKSKSKTPKGDRACTACSKELKSETPEKEPDFTYFTLKVEKRDKRKKWIGEVDKILAATEGVRQWGFDGEGDVLVSGYIDRSKFIRRVRKASENIQIEKIDSGLCSSNLFRKKEAPSTKKAGPSTDKANPPTLGYYQPQGYGSYYGSVGFTGNGGCYDNIGFYGNGGYNGNYYNYQPEPAVYQKRIGYDHIDCAGDASECSFYHNGKEVTQDKTPDQSSENTVPKPAGSRKRN